MTTTLMGRLFIVPALVVCVLLGVAVVVIMFGASSLDKPQSIDDLLTRIEADSGDRTLGMLLPGAKESWQAAQELARRLEHKDRFLKPDEVAPITQRIIEILEKLPDRPSAEGGSSDTARRGQARKLFLISALGQLESPLAIESLTGFLDNKDALTRQAALQSIARLGKVHEIQQTLPRIYPLLDDREPAVQMIACLTVASLAGQENPEAIRNVAQKLESDREIQWNAAMALARMGSSRGKLVLMNMLDRSFWETLKLDYQETNVHVQRAFTEAEVNYRLRAAIDAASRLDDKELKSIILQLSENDKSPQVRDAALAAMKKLNDEQAHAPNPTGLRSPRLCRGGSNIEPRSMNAVSVSAVYGRCVWQW